MKVGIELDHEKALRILTDAGGSLPSVPPGCNTALTAFATVDGLPAVAVNQSGFAPHRSDNEEQVNGLSVFVAIEGGDQETLMNYVRGELRLK